MDGLLKSGGFGVDRVLTFSCIRTSNIQPYKLGAGEPFKGQKEKPCGNDVILTIDSQSIGLLFFLSQDLMCGCHFSLHGIIRYNLHCFDLKYIIHFSFKLLLFVRKK